jgi:5-methylcytosine-specific restriction endonuclease McrA
MAQRFSKSFYNSKQWQGIRDYILKRDNYICICGKPANEVHHITWLTNKNINDPMISSGDKNLISLCRGCHCEIHMHGKSGVLKTNQKRLDDEPEYIFDNNGQIVPRRK